MASFQAHLAARFSLKSLGFVGYFLGIEVLPSSTDYLLSQHKYVLDLLHRYDMANSDPAPTPLSATAKLVLKDGSPLADITLYKQVIGSLQYILCTGPDIASAFFDIFVVLRPSVSAFLQPPLPPLLPLQILVGLVIPVDCTSNMAHLISYGGNLVS
ncbi:unnamed protein product [Linum trigynum]|uniref:Reverse transcriptase Ty1/copia-type domain-containing protein n=1 Tax=Linum trigynum TaxID=586398 RepID=A0AAV2GLC5_9ROSI